MSNKNYELSVSFNGLSKSELISLVAFFERWGWCSNVGASGFVGYYVDGDGSFHPKIEMMHNSLEDMGLTQKRFDELKKRAEVLPEDQRTCRYAFDPDWVSNSLQKAIEI